MFAALLRIGWAIFLQVFGAATNCVGQTDTWAQMLELSWCFQRQASRLKFQSASFLRGWAVFSEVLESTNCVGQTDTGPRY